MYFTRWYSFRWRFAIFHFFPCLSLDFISYFLPSIFLSFFLFLGCSPFSVSSCLVELVPFCFCFFTIWFGLDFSLLLLSIYHLVFNSSSSQSINYVFSSLFFSSSSVSPFYSLSHILVPYFRSQTLSSHTHASGSIRKALWTQYVPDRLKKILKNHPHVSSRADKSLSGI